LVANIWALVIIFRRSTVGGVISFLFILPVFYYLVTGWGKEGQDIKKPFFASVALWVIGVVLMAFGAKDLVQESMQQMSPPASSAPSARQAPAPRENIRVQETPAPKPAAEPQPLAAPQPAAAPLPVAAPKAPAPRAAIARPVQEAPRPLQAAPSPCVYKPVMTDEDMAKCR
jgi:hypothetical protein